MGRPSPASFVLVTAAYVVAGKLGLIVASAHPSASPVWAPTGIALAAVLLLGWRIAPAIFAGAFLVNISNPSGALAANLSSPPVIGATLGIALGNALEAIASAWLIERFGKGGKHSFDTPAGVALYAGLGGLAGTMVSATIGVASLCAAGLAPAEKALGIWVTWWLGDVGGALVVAPVILLWVHDTRRTRTSLIEVLYFWLLVILIGGGIFAGLLPGRLPLFSLSFLAVPLLVWGGLRMGRRSVSIAVLAMFVFAAWGTMRGRPLEPVVPAFMAIYSLMALSFAAMAEMEARLAERTAELTRLNRDLKDQMAGKRRSDANLRASEARLAEAQETARIGNFEWDVATDKVTWSSALYKIWGVTPGSFAATYDAYLALIHPDDRALVDRTIKAAYKAKEAFTVDHRVMHADGAVRWVQGRGRVSLDAEGRVVRMAGTCQDITESKRAEEALRRSEEQYRVMFEANPFPMWVADRDSLALLAVNPATVAHYGWTRDELLSMTVNDLVAEATASRVRHRKKDGTIIDVEVTRHLISFSARQAWLTLVHDVTERVRAQEERDRLLVELERRVEERTSELASANDTLKGSLAEKEVLLKEIHHRVKNNLQVISSLLRLQAQEIEDGRTAALFYESQARVQSMALIHEQLYRAGNLAQVDFAAYLRHLAPHLARSYQAEDRPVALSVEAAAVTLPVDSAIPCGLIVNELITNALKHAFPGRDGKILVRLEVEDGKTTLIVRDDGIGFPANVDFRQSRSLGLQLVCALTSQVGGTIELKREAGTEFAVRFSA